jgi:hypothetical protein
MTRSSIDSDATKGAVEDDGRGRYELRARQGIENESRVEDKSNVSQGGQLGHRDKPVGFEDADSDFPDPESSGEHTGQK